MQSEKTSLTKIWISGISWNLENEDLNGNCYSKCFFSEENDRSFYLELIPRTEGIACLFLWQIQGTELKTLNVLVGLWYEDKPKYFIYRSNNSKNSNEQHNLGYAKGIQVSEIIETHNLSEIRMHILNADTFSICEDKKESNEQHSEATSDEELSKDYTDLNLVNKTSASKKERNSKEKEYEEESLKETDIEAAKSSGEIALIKNIKDVFFDEEDSDVILKVEDQNYPAHKVIIRASSPVFYAMLKHDMKEKQEGAIDIKDCNPIIFREFLHYLYSGKLDNITDDNVFELYRMSDIYDVKELRMDCIDFIRYNLSVKTICDVISLATKHCENDLLTQATHFFIDNVQDVITTVNWQNFLKENPIEANELFIKTVKSSGFNKM